MTDLATAEQIHDFEDFYTSKLQPYFAGLKDQRKKADHWGIAAILIALSIIGYLLLPEKILGAAPVIIGVIAFITAIYQFTTCNDRFLDEFKMHMVGEILAFISPGAIYKPMSYVSKKEYRQSGLLRTRVEAYDGDDYWSANYMGVSFHCSEIRSGINEGDSDSVFNGLFVSAKINPIIAGGTYVWAKGAVQLPASIADERYRMYPLPEVIRLGINHEPFGKYFSVYTTDPNEASYLLDEERMDSIARLRQQIRHDISFSFVAGRCYIALPIEVNLWEPDLDTLEDKDKITEYFFSILFIFDLTRKLQLDRLT